MLISEQPTWNPIQCWVWIRYRTDEALNVLGAGTAYASYVTYEHEENRSANNKPFREICPNATEELSTKLIKGLIIATGTDPDTNRTVEINRNWWRNATLSRLRPGETQFGTPKYGNILLDVSEVKSLWKSFTGGPSSLTYREAEKLATAHLSDIAIANVHNPQGTAKQTQDYLREKFPPLTGKAAKRAWFAAAREGWKKPGAKPKKVTEDN